MAKKQCKYGDALHYSFAKEAREAYEITQEALTSFKKESLSPKELDRYSHMSRISGIPVAELAHEEGKDGAAVAVAIENLHEQRVEAAQEARAKADANPNSMGDEIEAQRLEKLSGLSGPRRARKKTVGRTPTLPPESHEPSYDYDLEELSVMDRMKKVLKDKYDWEDQDFEGMTFGDVESEFLDHYGEEDFRPKG